MKTKPFYIIRQLTPNNSYYRESCSWLLLKCTYWYLDPALLMCIPGTFGLFGFLIWHIDKRMKQEDGYGFYESILDFHPSYEKAYESMLELKVKTNTSYPVEERVFK